MKLQVANFLVFLLPLGLFAQNNKDCIAEVLRIEAKNSITSKKEEDKDKAFYLSYIVKTTDWEDKMITSNVKVYKGENDMHFFSEQGKIFQDQEEVYTILPMQKLVMINTVKKEMFDARLGADFYAFRKNLLDSCEVISCTASKEDANIKTLKLKVNDDLGGRLQIKNLIYTYNIKTEKIISTTTYYSSDYKIKRVEMIFKEINLAYVYKFNKAKKYVLDKNGNLLPQYKDYELIDNRDI